MLSSMPQMDVLHHLYESQRLYITELSRVNEGLEKLYKKLAKIDAKRDTAESCETPRTERRKLRWSSTVTSQSINKLEEQRAQLYSLLQQCRDAIFAYSNDPFSTPATPWTTYLPPTPFRLPFLSPWPVSSWSTGPMSAYSMDQPAGSYHWDPATDSQTSEPFDWASDLALNDGSSLEGTNLTDHVYSHELLLPTPAHDQEQAFQQDSSASTLTNDANPQRKKSVLIAIDTDKANQLPIRRKSENVLAMRSKVNSARDTQRGASAAPVSRSKTAPALME